MKLMSLPMSCMPGVTAAQARIVVPHEKNNLPVPVLLLSQTRRTHTPPSVHYHPQYDCLPIAQCRLSGCRLFLYIKNCIVLPVGKCWSRRRLRSCILICLLQER
ncbi:hypothetical protein BD289DRAFT_154969 [Coniella lustricola]|uniref:Uncharacterized protein n=1 Tax=Coniella lustricola TaxID=2025994 RepID=A0A2T3AME3_9PEZI|nr:hypothetical protein BD289DRAFT_154969 [Coniella lustricola]